MKKTIIIQPPIVDQSLSHTYPALPYLAASVSRRNTICITENINAKYISFLKKNVLTTLKKIKINSPNDIDISIEDKKFIYWTEFLSDMLRNLDSRVDVTCFGHVVIDDTYCIDSFFNHIWNEYKNSLKINVPLYESIDSWINSNIIKKHSFVNFLNDECFLHIEPHDSIAITIPFHSTLGFGLCIAKKVKDICKESKVIFGGPLFSVLPTECIDKILESSYVDCIVVGEGENIIPIISHHSSWNDIIVAAKKNNTGVVLKKNGIIFFPSRMDLKTLPIAIYSFEKFGEAGVVQSRGCYWGKCAYCTYYKIYPSCCYSERPLTSLLEEIVINNNNGYDKFMLCCDALSPRYAELFSQNLIKLGIDIHWQCFIRPELFSIEQLLMMKESGAYNLVIGLESINQRLLDFVNKGVSSGTIEKLFDRLSSINFKIIVNIIPDLPTTTIEEAGETLLFLNKYRDVISKLNVSRFVVPRNSSIGLNPSNYGIEICANNDSFFEDTIAWKYKRILGASGNDLNAVMKEFDKLATEIGRYGTSKSDKTDSVNQDDCFIKKSQRFITGQQDTNLDYFIIFDYATQKFFFRKEER